MMFRLIFLTLYLLQSSFYTNGQNVQTMPAHDSCVSTSITLRCPPGYVVIVRSAFYGVAPVVVGSCSYKIGDCIADAMSIMTCASDGDCSIYVTRKKLPQCNDHFATYIHAEYDCVPISMDDSAKDYNVCQNGTDITSDHGIIKSPNYPTQFQATTSECFRAIHVPTNKTIRLWLTDLYIGSAINNCADDHAFVVDSIQTYQFCGFKRYAYPYLCSSTILIQYLITTVFPNYRGMRMYFEIVDRPPNDTCPNPGGTVTPIPATTPTITTIDPDLTTPTPIYVTLGIASPVRNVQLCKGDSYKFDCPNDYVLTVIRNIFGVTGSNECKPHDASQYCIITTDPTFLCRQSCTYLYSGHQQIPSCGGQIADYQYIEYQCIPTNTELISNTSCPTDGSKTSIQIAQRGRFQSYNYPNLQNMNCIYHLITNPGYVMHFYSLDISMNSFLSDCQGNKLTFIETDGSPNTDFCEQRSFSLIYSSCSNELDLVYTVTNDAALFSKGAELYIETQTRSIDWSCGKPLTSSIGPTNSITPFTTPTATPLKNDSFIGALDEIEYDICYGSASTYVCPLGYTFMIIGAYYGVKDQTSNKCGFVQGDCTQEALSSVTECNTDVPNCYLSYPNRRRLAHCSDKYADYLHITSQCVPSTSASNGSAVKTYDICGTDDQITDIHGIITSTNFPTFTEVLDECKKTIVDVQDRILKIWINELNVPIGSQRHLNADSDPSEPDLVIYKTDATDDLNNVEEMFPSIRDTCVKDYLMVNTPYFIYIYCGSRKLAIAPICAKTVVIRYKSTSLPSSLYKGFKLYFEWVEKPMEIWCGGFPDLENTTTPIDEPVPAWAQNLELSPVLSAHLCLGTSTTLRCPRGSDYVLSIIESNYGVTGSGLCEIPAASHCRQEASLGLACTQSCFIQYNIPQSLSQCGSQNADYLNIDYECIPTRLPNNEVPIDICSSSISDTITIDTGMIVSPQYPTLGAERNCSKKIKTLSNKLWMVFLVDVSIEGANDAGVCDAASLTLHDGIDQIIRCGLHLPELVLISCSDIIEFKFISSHYALGYRGFKVYFQTVNTPPDWACKPPGSSTTPGITTPRPESTTTLVPPSIQIAAYGGTTNGTRQYCKIPFIYQSNSQAGCIRVDPPDSTSGQKDPWCSLTSNFDIDRQWGFCDLGVTDSLMHDVCRSKPQLLLCPSGYLIDILTADYAAKPDGSIDTNACIYDQNDCFESDAPLVQSQCGGLSACVVYHLDRPLSLCQNRPSAYLHVAYTCIPNDIPEINKYDICNSSSVIEDDTRRGFIMSPNFPSVHTNIDCTFNLQTSKSYQDIYLYIVDMDLNGPTIPEQNCEKDRLIVTADNTINEMCGKSYPNLLVYTCHKSVTLQLIRTTGAIGLGVKFYFEFRDKPPFQLCPSLPSTTTSLTLSPTPSTTTTTGPLPVYYPNPSPRMLKALCYPDLSGLMGAQNFRCPSDYVLVIHRAFYGFGSRCDYTSGDCTTEADIVYRTCAGRQSCSVSFINIVFIQECSNVQANYLFVEYQCLPTLAIVSNSSDLCTGKIDQAGISGILTSLSYPTYTTTQCANTTITSLESSNLIVYMYLLDLNIGSPKSDTGECSDDYLLLSYQCNNQTYDRRLCGTQPTELLFSTCEPTDQIFASYRLIGLDHQAQRGFALLYHLLPKSDIFTIVTRSTTPATTPSTPGPVSTKTQTETICVTGAAQLKCDIPDYVLVIRKARLAASATNSCIYSPNDCFEDNDNLYNHCPGKTYCFIAPPTLAMNLCNNSTSDYLYVEYQCIPILPKLNLDVCSSNKSFERVEGGAIISSLNYVSENKQCIVDLRSNKLIGSTIHIAFKVYILSLNLPMRSSLREQGAQCSEDDPYIDIDDHELAVTRLCGNSHTRYLLESCSPMIEIRFNNKIISTGEVQYKGFELYFESIQNDECRVTTAPPIPTEPFVIKNETICTTAGGEERVDFSCTPDHGLVFLQSYYFFRAKPDQCDLNYHTCSYRSDQPQGQCAGQQACSYTHVIPFEPESNPCGNKRADSVQFYYQCLPMRPTAEFSTFTFCSVESVSGNSGFIETPSYPNTYQHGQKNCSLSIQLPANNDNTSYSIYLYVLELSIRDTSIMNSSSPIQCFDSIKYTDGVKTHFLCGKIDQPILEYHTNKKELNLTLNIPHASSPSEWSTWQGARLFFYIGNQSLPSPPSLTTTPPPIRTTTTTPDVEQTSPKSKPDSDNEALTIALTIICVLTVLAALIGFGYYRRRQSRYRGKHIPVVTYDADMNTVDDDPKHEPLERRNSSIPSDAFKGTGTFVNPLFGKSSANSKLQTENETSA